MQYYFTVGLNECDDMCCDYNITVMDDTMADNIGCHIEEVKKVMEGLGIESELMENEFVGLFNDKIKTVDDVEKYLLNAGWKQITLDDVKKYMETNGLETAFL